jgi:hypothetical protein
LFETTDDGNHLYRGSFSPSKDASPFFTGGFSQPGTNRCLEHLYRVETSEAFALGLAST